MKVFVIFFCGLLPSFFVQASCNFDESNYLDELSSYSSAKSISIDVPRSGKWNANLIRAQLDESQIIKSDRKKYFKAKVKINYAFGSCVYPAEIRLTGDWSDHIDFSQGIASLKVKLQEGSLGGIVKFKLLLPRSRNDDNEIFATHLLKALGLMAPRTRFVTATVNNQKPSKYLLQEDFTKELLEANGRREGPILEGDESLIFLDSIKEVMVRAHISLAKVVNTKWADSGESARYISSKALGQLQKAYLIDGNIFSTKHGENNIGWIWLPERYLDQGNIRLKNTWASFHLLMLGMGAYHGLISHNRRFYWNSFENGFEPIYNDGGAKFEITSALSIRDTQYSIPLYREAFKATHIDKVLIDLNKIDLNTLFYEMKKDGFESGRPSFEDKFSLLARNIQKYKSQFDNLSRPNSNYDSLDNKFFSLNVKKFYVNPIYISHKYDRGQIFYGVCKDFIDCQDEQFIDIKDYKKLLKNHYDVVYDMGGGIGFDKAAQFSTLVPGVGRIFHSKDFKISYNERSRELFLIPYSPSDWVLFSHLTIKNLKIRYIANGIVGEDKKKSQRFNREGLTGCINFYNVKFDRTSINASNGMCEDTINIVSSKGTINQIEISSAFEDALDIDFSNITINSVSVDVAGNDCLDLSSGIYSINKAVLNGCKDKSLSLGEQSYLNAHTISSHSSAVGIAVKDSSVMLAEHFNGNNINQCYSVYKKKQEFFGAKLNVVNGNCLGRQLNFSDSNSSLRVPQ